MNGICEKVISALPSKHKKEVTDLFQNYGESLGIQLGTALLYAKEAEKIKETLVKLESHYKETVQYQHPGIRAAHYRNIDFFNELNETLVAEKSA